jgi:ABC-2 type transport system ATP-binding protein
LEIVEKLCTDVGIIAKGKLVHQSSMDELRQGSSLEERFWKRSAAGSAKAQIGWL